MNTETCLHCAHADFETTKGSEMQGFAKCLKAVKCTEYRKEAR